MGAARGGDCGGSPTCTPLAKLCDMEREDEDGVTMAWARLGQRPLTRMELVSVPSDMLL